MDVTLSKRAETNERELVADALLAELDAIAESIAGEFDSAEDIRLIREERVRHLSRSPKP